MNKFNQLLIKNQAKINRGATKTPHTIILIFSMNINTNNHGTLVNFNENFCTSMRSLLSKIKSISES